MIVKSGLCFDCLYVCTRLSGLILAMWSYGTYEHIQGRLADAVGRAFVAAVDSNARETGAHVHDKLLFALLQKRKQRLGEMTRPYDVRLKRLRQIFGFEGEPEIVSKVLGYSQDGTERRWGEVGRTMAALLRR